MSHNSLREQFGDIDIYLFDQILRGRIQPGMKIFDAGCGEGRNSHYLRQQGYEVYGVDSDPRALRALPASNFRAESLEEIGFPADFADVVIVSAVLHFARNEAHFNRMLQGVWRILRPGGLFFCRLASSIGIENRIQSVSDHRYLLPDGSERYLVDEPSLLRLTAELGASLLDPIKTTVVQNQRSMDDVGFCASAERKLREGFAVILMFPLWARSSVG